MKKNSIKKFLLGLMILTTMMSFVSCSSKEKALKAVEGKDGVFALLETEKGIIALELFYKETPMTVANFVGLAEGTLNNQNGTPFYDGLTFHRVIENFMIQGGDPAGNGTGGPNYEFPDEFVDGLEFDGPGKLAMANAGPGTNGSQFFITHMHTEWLNNKHTIFGQVVEGQDVVNKVAQGDHIISLKIVRNGEDAEKFLVNDEIFENLIVENNKKLEEKIKKQIEENRKFVENMAKDYELTDDGIYYKIVEEGTGDLCGAKRAVGAEYLGYLPDGQVFDGSSGMVEGGHEPIYFVTGAGQMIPGFDVMVQEMKLNETRKIIVPPHLAYGSRGVPGYIPPHAYICFDIQLIKY